MTEFYIRVGTDGYVTMIGTEDGPVEGWVDTYYVDCTNDRGDHWVLDSKHDEKDLAAAEAAAEAARNEGVNPTTAPERWFDAEPCYGSEAWDAEAEYRLACFEADAYDEPRPRW